mgnify:CR=1 FL=1
MCTYIGFMRAQFLVSIVFILAGGSGYAEAPVEISEAALEASGGKHGVVLLSVNWGRQWGCAGLDNAQLQALTFTRRPDGPTLDFTMKSKLFAKDGHGNVAVLIEPGTWDLTGFDVKVAESMRKVGHITKSDETSGGSFEVAAGEFVYIGHFSLDCSQEASPWRYYIVPGSEFEGYVDGFRQFYPFIGDVEVRYGLFETDEYGGALPAS